MIEHIWLAPFKNSFVSIKKRLFCCSSNTAFPVSKYFFELGHDPGIDEVVLQSHSLIVAGFLQLPRGLNPGPMDQKGLVQNVKVVVEHAKLKALGHFIGFALPREHVFLKRNH